MKELNLRYLIILLLFSVVLPITALTQDSSIVTLERLFSSSEFDSERFGPARWLDEGKSYTTLEPSETKNGGRDIVRYITKSGKRNIMVPATRLVPPNDSTSLNIDNYEWSTDKQQLLIFTNTKRVWRRNTRGDYWVVDLKTWKKQKLGGDAEPSTLMFAKFSPDGRRVAYVREKNIYVEDIQTGKITQLTTGGSDIIINGTSDWVYEEEFGLRDGFCWSPDGTKIAYWQFNTEGIGTFFMINNTDSLYSKLIPVLYPKVGSTNSACQVGVVSTQGGPTTWFKVSGDPRNHYIPIMEWADNSEQVIIQQLNRLQNTNKVMLGSTADGSVQTILIDRDDAWVNVNRDIKWINKGKYFSWVSERDGWRHIYVISRDGKENTLQTPGDFDIIRVQSVDKKNGWFYYIASPDNPTQRYLFRVRINGDGKAERLTPIEKSGIHSYQMSPNSKWAFHTHSSFDAPPVISLVSLPNHKIERILVDNKKLQKKVNALKIEPTEFFRIEIEDGVELDAWCMKPPDFDSSKQYPLFFYVYGEPAGQTVLDRWGGKRYLWHQMLAQQGYLVMSVDNRGTPAPRGRAWRKSIYRQIGILASSDQAAATRAIFKTRLYVDSTRVGIWGWSGGGSMTLNAMFRYPDLYHTGMAIAFISNQRFYDTIYQERYMGLPDDNEEGFTNGSPITFTHQLKGNLLIIHGTADDNCHYQNFEALVNELIKHNKKFTMMSYPNRTHSINEGSNTRRHLNDLLTSYLNNNLPPGPR